ncbi:sensor histidine kinase [Myxococcaceae bacterium GXIMD 01537]
MAIARELVQFRRLSLNAKRGMMGAPSRELELREREVVADVVAAALRHELRNRLASIRNASFYLMSRVKQTELWAKDPHVGAFFELIDQEVSSAEGVLEAPRGSAARGAGAVSLREVAEEVLSGARVPEAVRVERAWAEVPALPVDARDAVLMVRCLVENALEAMPEGGTLRVSTRHDAAGCVLEVADTGPGMAPGVASRAFEPFVTTKPGHAGLGLCIARALGLRYGARVALSPASPGGLRVELRFSAVRAGQDPAAPAL